MNESLHSPDPRAELEGIQPTNPIARSWAQGRSVDAMWLTNKRPLNNLQRLGVLLMTSIAGIAGASFIQVGVVLIRDGKSFTGALDLIFGAVVTYLAARGLWRVWHDVFKGPARKAPDEVNRRFEPKDYRRHKRANR